MSDDGSVLNALGMIELQERAYDEDGNAIGMRRTWLRPEQPWLVGKHGTDETDLWFCDNGPNSRCLMVAGDPVDIMDMIARGIAEARARADALTPLGRMRLREAMAARGRKNE